MGGEFRRNEFDTNLPEEQATEFEKFDNFTQILRGLATEADTQFGITDKQFRFNDFNLFLADDWRLSPSLTLNLGVRYEFFGLPTEVNGRIGNVDFDALTSTENPVNAFIVPKNVQNTGFARYRRRNRRLGKGRQQPHARRVRTGTTLRPGSASRGRRETTTSGWSAEDMGSSSTARRRRSSIPCSATTRSCASRK